jgi:hypothetical protein
MGGVAVSSSASAATVPHQGMVWFTTPTPTGQVVGSAVTLRAALRKPHEVVMFITETPEVCQLDGAAKNNDAKSWSQRITMVGAGTCTVEAASLGYDETGTDTGASQSFRVSEVVHPAAIWFTSAAPTAGAVGTWVTIKAAVRELYGAVAFGVEDPKVCRLTGAAKQDDALHWSQRVTLANTGTCTVFAYTTADDQTQDWETGAPQSFSARRIQAIQNVMAPQKTVLIGQHETITPRGGGSGNPVVPSISSLSGAGVCTVSTVSGSAEVRFVKPGFCRVDFNQAGNDTYLPGSSARAFIVRQGQQAITFTSEAPTTALPGDAFLPSYVTGGASGNPVYLYPEGPLSVCYLSAVDHAIHFLNAGTCVVHATQAGNASYQDAPEAVRIVTVINPWADGAFDSDVDVIGR